MTIDYSDVKQLFHPYAYNCSYLLMLCLSNFCICSVLLKSINIKNEKIIGDLSPNLFFYIETVRYHWLYRVLSFETTAPETCMIFFRQECVLTVE